MKETDRNDAFMSLLKYEVDRVIHHKEEITKVIILHTVTNVNQHLK